MQAPAPVPGPDDLQGPSLAIVEALPYAQAAQRVIRLLFSSRAWVNRRVDSVSLVDLMTVTRTISVDVCLPDHDALPVVDGLPLLPIALIEKGPMVNFHSMDEKGDSWALCTLSRTQALEKAMLRVWAKQCGVFLTESQEDVILTIDPAERTRSADVLQRLQDSCKEPRQQAFLVLAKILARNRIIFAEVRDDVSGPVPRGKVLRFTYDRPVQVPPSLGKAGLSDEGTRAEPSLTPDHRWGQRLQRAWSASLMRMKWWMAANDVRRGILVNAANSSYARQYHFELTAPSGVVITDAALYDDETGRGLSSRWPSVRGELATRCDLYKLGSREVPTGVRARALLILAPLHRTWMNVVMIVTAVSGLLLIMMSVALRFPASPDPGASGPSGTTLIASLLTFSGTILAVATNSEEDNLSRRIQWPFRRIVLTGAGLGVVFAVAAYGIEGTPLPKIAAAAVALAGGLVAIAFSAWELYLIRRCPHFSDRPRRRKDGPSEAVKEDDLKEMARGIIYHLPRPVAPNNWEHRQLRDYGIQDEIRKAVLEWGLVPADAGKDWWQQWPRAEDEATVSVTAKEK